ncbi:MAG: calcium-binding protein [Paracoccaceae bacterium]|nr:calcium-binding protein [Paracoccaceae bacterium]
MAQPTQWAGPFQVNTGDASIGFQSNQNVLGLANGWILVTWDEGQNGVIGASPRGDIVGKIYDADGLVVYDSFQLNSYFFSDGETDHNVTATHDGFAISFVDASEARYGPDERAIRFEQFDLDGPKEFATIVGVQSNFLTTSKFAVNLVPESAGFYVPFNDITLDYTGARLIDGDGNVGRFIQPPAAAPGATVFTHSVDVLSDGSYRTIYSISDGSDTSYAFSVFDSAGTALTPLIEISVSGSVNHFASLAGGGFVIAFRLNNEVYSQVYDSTGAEVGTLHYEPNSSGSHGAIPRVIGLHDGGFILAWDTDPVNDVYARRFNADGTPESDAFFVGAGGTFNSADVEIGLAADGRVLFGWQGPNNELFSSIWDPRGEIINPDDYGQIRTNFLATDVITTGVNGSTVLEGEIGDTILGQAGDDIIYTSGSGDFYGGGGNDLIISSADFALPGDFKYLNGEAGIDTLDTTAFNGNYAINLETGETDYFGAPAEAREAFYNFENLIAGNGNDDLKGSSVANRIEGGGGSDRILGFAGNDVLIGEEGNDRLNGGEGDDLLEGGAGDDRLYAGAGNDSLDGGVGNDVLVGEAGDDSINGGDGNDILRGGEGQDTLSGEEGDDTGFGGDGNDTMHGGLGNDTLNGGGGNDIINGDAGDDVLAGDIGTDTLTGGDGDDILRGGGGNDMLSGQDGNDLIFGGSGEDMLFGGAGNDILDGNAQADQLFGGAGVDTLRGGDGFDLLEGGADNDVLVGGNGNDVLNGGGGQDILRGQANNDVFVFSAAAESAFGFADLIDGIAGVGAAGGDVIDLSAIDADTQTAGTQAFTFLGALTTAQGLAAGAGSLWVENANDQTRVYGLTDGDNAIDLAIRINDGVGILAGDYLATDFIL